MITPGHSFLEGVSTLIWLTRFLLKKKKEKMQVLSHLMSSSCAVRRRQLVETFRQMSSSKASVMFSVLVAALQAAAELLRYPPGAKKLAHFVPEEGFGF